MVMVAEISVTTATITLYPPPPQLRHSRRRPVVPTLQHRCARAQNTRPSRGAAHGAAGAVRKASIGRVRSPACDPSLPIPFPHLYTKPLYSSLQQIPRTSPPQDRCPPQRNFHGPRACALCFIPLLLLSSRPQSPAARWRSCSTETQRQERCGTVRAGEGEQATRRGLGCVTRVL